MTKLFETCIKGANDDLDGKTTHFYWFLHLNKGIRMSKTSHKQSLSTMSNMDRQLLRQKTSQKFSVLNENIKTGVSIKIVCFGILIQVLS